MRTNLVGNLALSLRVFQEVLDSVDKDMLVAAHSPVTSSQDSLKLVNLEASQHGHLNTTMSDRSGLKY